MRIDEEEEWAERETEPHTRSLFVGPYVLIDFYSQWGHKRVSEEGGICVFIQLMHSVVHDVVKQLYSSKKRNM